MPFRERVVRCDLCDTEMAGAPRELGGLRACAPCDRGRNTPGLIAGGLHLQTVEHTGWDWSRTRALGATDFQLSLDARFGWEGFFSRRRKLDLQTGDRLFDDAILVQGEGDVLGRLLAYEPVRLAVRRLVLGGDLCLKSGTLQCQASGCGLDELRAAATVITWGVRKAAQESSAHRVDGEVRLPWLQVLSTDAETLTLSGDRVDPRELAALPPSLRALKLSEVVLTSGDLTPLTSLTGLQTLELVRVGGLAQLEPLGQLWLRGLSLAGCAVDDVAPLARLTSLEALDLRETRVSDLSPLGALRELKELRLTERAIDDAALADLRRRLPALTIVTEAL